MPLDIDYTYRTVGNHPYKIGKAYRLDYETLIELEIKAAPRGDFILRLPIWKLGAHIHRLNDL
jgi:hypothetical protein